MKRVVITGMGIYSCLGTTLEQVRDALYHGRSGIVCDPTRKQIGFRSTLTAHLDIPDLKPVLNRHQRAFLPEEGQYAYCATLDALKNAGIDEDYLLHNTVGILYGNDSSAEAVMKGVDRIRLMKDTTMCGAAAIFQSMNSTITMNLGCLFHLKGINLTLSAACASGSHAIGLGALLIRDGLQEMIICGGAQEANAIGAAAFDGISAFSTREDEPTKASRPFDRDRDGLVPSGGAATLILEEYEHAVKRGATILGEVIGYGFSGNGEHIANPNISGPIASLQNCLRDAGIKAEDIQYINAHATSTPIGDSSEAQAIFQVFGEKTVPVTSTKSMTGHEMWAAGATETVYSLLMMHNDFIAPNINFENPDEDSQHLWIPSTRLDKHFDTFLNNSFGFGGTNSSLIIRKI
ncbi:MAG: beta-ketoacyl-[acyl-carrier-protein] synthase family protein [Paludibacteraceae bacterium]|nr:beta-ketoacyl-[acyl-carrier-protein] synthase family protein [Paludibacteraceae bacterium]